MPHATRTPHSLPPLLLAWLLPVTTGGAWAEAGAPANAATPALAIAELAEDENVEDVEHSAPLAGGDTTADAPAPAAEAEPVAEPPARRVAPHVDLKEVPPPPAPESTPAPAAAPPTTSTRGWILTGQMVP